ncbi:MAG: hypothetical protein AB7C97_08260 [Oscillospiraceae bacterium]
MTDKSIKCGIPECEKAVFLTYGIKRLIAAICRQSAFYLAPDNDKILILLSH